MGLQPKDRQAFYEIVDDSKYKTSYEEEILIERECVLLYETLI